MLSVRWTRKGKNKKMRKQIKKSVLYILTVALAIVVPFTSAYAKTPDMAYPYSYVEELPVYGYCSGDEIITVFLSEVTTSGRIVKIEKLLMLSDPKSLGLPFVVYKYTDSNGNMYIPYIHHNYNQNNLTQTAGNFGVCPK